jgi:hypothetical protein
MADWVEMTIEEKLDHLREEKAGSQTIELAQVVDRREVEMLALIAIVGASAGATPPRQDFLDAWTRTLEQATPRLPEFALQEQVQKSLKALWPGHT